MLNFHIKLDFLLNESKTKDELIAKLNKLGLTAVNAKTTKKIKATTPPYDATLIIAGSYGDLSTYLFSDYCKGMDEIETDEIINEIKPITDEQAKLNK